MKSNAFDEAVKEAAAKAVGRAMDPEAGRSRMHLGRAAAATKHGDKIEAARRIARELGQYGPVSIDDLLLKLVQAGYDTDAANKASARMWKGCIFTTGEWVPVGTTPSKVAANHARPVRTWAMKSWLAGHPMNGTDRGGSAFSLFGILKQYERANPGCDTKTDCVWLIGLSGLSEEIKYLIKAERGKLYGVSVVYLTDTCGATLKHDEGTAINAKNFEG